MKVLVLSLVVLSSCTYLATPQPIGFTDGRIMCCTVNEDSYKVELQCGDFKIERASNFVRLNGTCRPRQATITETPEEKL